MQLSILLIYLFVGTYRLSSHARLEAFVIQTKLNGDQEGCRLGLKPAPDESRWQYWKGHVWYGQVYKFAWM